MFDIEFYEKENGKVPVADFLDSLSHKNRAKVASDIWLLGNQGNLVGMPKSKPLKNGLFELRSKFPDGISRIFYFFMKGNKIVMTNGFIKKTLKTPGNEIETALKYKSDYERRMTHEV